MFMDMFSLDVRKFKVQKELCDLLGNGQSCYNVALFYAVGNGVEKDVSKAREYFQKAIRLGYYQGDGPLFGYNEEDMIKMGVPPSWIKK